MLKALIQIYNGEWNWDWSWLPPIDFIILWIIIIPIITLLIWDHHKKEGKVITLMALMWWGFWTIFPITGIYWGLRTILIDFWIWNF